MRMVLLAPLRLVGIVLAIPVLLVGILFVCTCELALGFEPGPRLKAFYVKWGSLSQWLLFGPTRFAKMKDTWLGDEAMRLNREQSRSHAGPSLQVNV